ncbi:MAG: hypothetical protein J5852_00310 [Clostridia bacterium]|nr:hypothetical protein [Clostridia bacterium]
MYLLNNSTFLASKRSILMVFLLSLIGGYPIGAKLLGELKTKGVITGKEAGRYLPFFVNAGPAFIVIAVGKEIIGNIRLGYILLAAHTIASVFICGIFMRNVFTNNKAAAYSKPTSDSFAESVKNASGTCITVCAFIIFFSVINGYLTHFSKILSRLKYLLYFTEITGAVRLTDNLYLISFLLGFAGVSIWVQVFSVAGKARVNHIKFILIRLLHGGISSAITYVLVKIFKIDIAAAASQKQFVEKIFYSDLTLALSLLIMILLFLINITAKKHSGNFLKDVL